MSATKPTYDLIRFRDIQDTCYHRVKAELSMGRKQGHWIWFIFPQLAGLGQSVTAREYALNSIDEAQAYLADGILGSRLRECCELLLKVESDNLSSVMSDIDCLKVRSSMTLFNQVSLPDPLFQKILEKFFEGKPDPLTLALLKQQ